MERSHCGLGCSARGHIEFVLAGEGEILLDGVWKKATAGCLYLLRAGEEHHYRSSPQNPWHKLWINYSADYLWHPFLMRTAFAPGSTSLPRHKNILISPWKRQRHCLEYAAPIKEIAERLHISDEHYFSTLFLRRTGIRPGDFRRRENPFWNL